MLPRLRNPLGGRHDLAVDLGTANTVVYKRGEGIVIFEPSVVAIDEETGTVQAIGESAKRMIGRTPASIRATRPLRHGVIADFEITEEMLRYFIRKAADRRSAPRVIVCVPTGITEVEHQAVQDTTMRAGAKSAHLIEEPMAAGIGARLPVQEPEGQMVVDIGGGTTEVAIISFGGIVTSSSVRVGGDELDEAIMQYVKKTHALSLGERSAEDVKLAIASASPNPPRDTTEIRGRDLVRGLPKAITLTTTEVQEAISDPLNVVVDSVRETLDRCPPELAGDIMSSGVVMTGGGALLHGLDERLRQEIGTPVHIADDPLTCVVRGAGECLEQFSKLAPVLMSTGPVGP
jgi:rod shape-determining protein MreB and related proteins